MSTIFYAILLLLIILIIVRFLPVDTEPFHEDPAEPDPQRSEVRLIGREAPRFQGEADQVLDVLMQIAREDGARIVQGGVDEGMITFVARSRLFGFRDFITVKAVDEAGGVSKLSVLARPRANFPDFGVNARRLDRWLSELDQAFRG